MICDKCGQEVHPSNDATFIEAEMTGNPFVCFFNQSRHFLPEGNCEGSPSRAQYIEGQPKDNRGYTYMPEYEQPWRDAYIKVQEKYPR